MQSMKKLFRPYLAAVLVGLSGALVAGAVGATGVPTIDVAKLTQDTVNQVANMAKYVEMIDQYKQQIEQMKAQSKALTGSRGLGTLMNDPQYASYLPADWRKVYNGVANGQYSGLSGTAKALRDGSRVLDLCKDVQDAASKALCQAKADKAASDQGLASDAYDRALSRWDQIQGLMGSINSTTDPKAIAELQARINGETAALQNEATKMQMFAMMSAAQDKVLEQQQREATVKAIRESKYVDVKPLEYRK